MSNLNSDRLLAAARAQSAIQSAINDDLAQRASLHNMEMEQQRAQIAKSTLDLNLRNELNQLRQERERKDATVRVIDFLETFDPLDPKSRNDLDQFKALASGVGISAPEIDQIFAAADMKDRALTQTITNWQAESGVDWIKDKNGRIDIDATRAEHENRLYLQKEQEATWAPSDHGLFRQILTSSKEGSVSYTPYEARQIVTESARAKNLYKELVANQLYDPGTRNFLTSDLGTPPATPGTPTGISPFLPSASYFNYENFYLDPGVAIAAKHLNRMKLGEVPEFQKDPQGNTVYDSKTGAAIITSWKLNPQRMKEDADARKAEFEATLTAQEANVSPEYKERARLRGATSALEKLDIGGTSTGARDTSGD